MPQRLQWSIKYHAVAGVAHYFADAGAHLGYVAVGGALFAEGFVVAIFAGIEPPVGVCFKLAAVGTKFAPLILLFASALYPNHQGHCALLPAYSISFHLITYSNLLRKHSTTSMSAGSHSTSSRFCADSHRAPICSLNSICPDRIMHL